MKILHLISGGDTGGAKTHVITLLKSLIKIEIDVNLLCVMEGEFTKEAFKNNIPTKIIKQSNRLSFKRVFEIKKYIEEGKFDLVHCHGARANFIAFLIKNKLNVPFISTLHSDYKLDFKDNFYKKIIFTPLNYLSLKHFDYILTVTNAFKNMLIKRGFDKDKLIPIYNGIDFKETNIKTKKNEFLKNYNIEYVQDYIYIGFVARLQYVKGIEYFLNAINMLFKEDKSNKIKVLIAGNGTLESYVKNFIIKNNLQNKVYMLGFVEDINSFYNVIDINVLSSISESFPYSLLEGARLKKATIATSVGGIPEMIENGKTGLLIPPKDYKNLFLALKELVLNKESRKILGENFYSFTKNRFSSEEMANTHKKIYKDIIKRR